MMKTKILIFYMGTSKTYNFIKTCLDELLEDKEQISLIIEYIKNKRQYKTIEDLKRYI